MSIETKIEAIQSGAPIPEESAAPEQEELQLVPDAEAEEEIEAAEEPQGAESLEEIEEDEGTLAAMLGLSDDQIDVKETGEVIIKTAINGEEVEVAVKDMLAAYQGTEFATKKSQEVLEKEQELERDIQEVQQAAATKLSEMKKVSELMEKELLADYNSHDWDRLNRENPAEYNRLKDMYSHKAQRLKGLKTSLTDEEKLQQEEVQNQQMEQYKKHLKVESQRLLVNNPTWHDPKVREKEMTELRTFMIDKYQYTEQELNQISDHRVIKLIQDAYKAQAPASTVKSKKVIPAFQSPSAGRVKAAANARAAKARRAALRKTGSTDALTQVLIDKFG